MHFSTVIVVDRAEGAQDALNQATASMAPFDENLKMGTPAFVEVDEGTVQRAKIEYVSVDEDPEPTAGTDEHNSWVARAVGWYADDHPRKGAYQDGVFGLMSNRNPNAMWDSWELGGRWSGWFPITDSVHFSEYALGSPSSYTNSLERVGYADCLQVKNLDRHRKIREATMKAQNKYDNFLRATHGMDYGLSYEEIAAKHRQKTGVDVLNDNREETNEVRRAVRREYFNQPFVSFNNNLGILEDPLDYWCINTGGAAEYCLRQLDKATVPDAFLRNGVWESRTGEDASEVRAWASRASDIFDDLDPESWLMMFDCRI